MRHSLLILALVLVLAACAGPPPAPAPRPPPASPSLMERRRLEPETAVLGLLRLGDGAGTLREALVATGLDPVTLDRASGAVRTEWCWDDRTLSLQRHDAQGHGPAPGRWRLLIPWGGRPVWTELDLRDGRLASLRIGGVRRPELAEGNLLASLYGGAIEPAERDARAWLERLGRSVPLAPVVRSEDGPGVILTSAATGLRLRLRLAREAYDNRPQITSSLEIAAEERP